MAIASTEKVRIAKKMPRNIFISHLPNWMLIVYPLVLLGMMIGKALQIKYRPGASIIVKLEQDK